jgi:hypothetical protein
LGQTTKEVTRTAAVGNAVLLRNIKVAILKVEGKRGMKVCKITITMFGVPGN